MTAAHAGLSRPGTKARRLQDALLDRPAVHERDDTLSTSHRFLFYELVQDQVVPKAATGRRRADQDTIDALTHLREVGLVPWDWIDDETRSLDAWRTADSVAAYVTREVDFATIDRWDGGSAPLILCESRSLAGALRDTASAYACPIASTNGQCRGFLVSQVAPTLADGQRVLYVGDFDWCGQQIETATRRTLTEHTGLSLPWERVALTAGQVDQHGLRALVIRKPDKRYKPVRYFDAVETEAFGQANIVATVRDRLDELMPEPLTAVLEREDRQRDRVAERLAECQGQAGNQRCALKYL
jgi:hypothetical protein